MEMGDERGTCYLHIQRSVDSDFCAREKERERESVQKVMASRMFAEERYIVLCRSCRARERERERESVVMVTEENRGNARFINTRREMVSSRDAHATTC